MDSDETATADDELRRYNFVGRRTRPDCTGRSEQRGSKHRRLEASTALDREAIEPKKETGSDLRQDLGDVGKLRSEVARFTHLVHAKFTGLADKNDLVDGRDRAGWIVPIFLLDWRRNPTREGRLRDAGEAWPWLADHYLHEAHDLYGPALGDTPTFYQQAAGECWTCVHRSDEVPPETYVEINPATASRLVLGRRRRGAMPSCSCSSDFPDTEHPQTVAPRRAGPRRPATADHPAGTVRGRAVAEQTQHRDRAAVAWVEDDLALGTPTNPNGFIIQAKLPNQRAYHRLVPTTINAEHSDPGWCSGTTRTPPGPKNCRSTDFVCDRSPVVSSSISS